MPHNRDATAGARQAQSAQSPQTHQADSLSPSSHFGAAASDRLMPKKDPPATRGRTPDPAALGGAPPPLLHRAQSAHPSQAEPIRARPPVPLETKPSNSYGHHRQTSVIHGVQHSRNTSLNSSNTNSPLTPETLGLGSSGRLDSTLKALDPSPSAPNSTRSGHVPAQYLPATAMTDQQHPVPSDTASAPAHQRKPTATSRPRRDHRPQPSHSRQHSEPRTPGEYALHHLLNAFVTQADHKINQCISIGGDLGTPVEQLCAHGVDPTFDQLIQALGHITRSKPKPLIDSLMYWRKAKAEASSQAKHQLHQKPIADSKPTPPSLFRRNTEPVQPNSQATLVVATDDPATTVVPGSLAEEAMLAERRATVSVYLVCRVLIEIFEQSSLEAINPELARRLEEIVFGQLKSLDAAQIATSSFRMANWQIYGLLLGYMSKISFVSVTHKFLHELDSCQRDISRNKGSSTVKDLESHTELLIIGMKHLQVRSSPDQAWIESVDFLRTLGRLFVNAHGSPIKQAYCNVIERLLLPVASDVRNDLSLPRWKDVLDIINPRLNQMLTKLRHWSTTYPLWSLLLCLAPREAFLSHWIPAISNLGPKLKDRPTRGFALQAVCRLTWTYLYRYPESSSGTTRRIEEIIRLALPQGRKTNISTEPFLVEPLIELVRIIGFKHPELCFRTIILPLINSDLFSSGKDLKIEQIEPEKMVVGIRAFLAIMADLENGERGRPAFPQTFSTVSKVEPLPSSVAYPRPQLLADPAPSEAPRDEVFLLPVDTTKLSEVAKNYYTRLSEILGKIAILCDTTFGGQAALNEKFGGAPKTPLAETFGFGKKDEGSSADPKQAYYDLLLVAIQALPRCDWKHVPLNSLINLLCTGSAHTQSTIAASSLQSLKSIAKQGYAQAVAIGYPRFIFGYDLKYSTMSDEGLLGPGHIETTLTLYIDLLKIWTEEIRQKKMVACTDDLDSGAGLVRGLPLEMSNVLTQVDEIESYGLFFLCCQSRHVRAFAIEVLRMVTDFDKALMRDQSSRIIHILQDDAHRILDLNEDHLSLAERSRVQKSKRKGASSDVLLEICTSGEAYDLTLWLKMFPNFIRVTFQMCPNIIALSRLKVCDRLVQMQTSIEFLADHTRSPQNLAQESKMAARHPATPPDVLVEQWKLYLTMACVTLSHPGAQSQSQLANAVHARKTSRPGVTSQEKIGSARSLFSAVIPLLSAGPDTIRNAIVLALGSINKDLYRTLLESLRYPVTTCNDEAKARIGAHHRSPSSPIRNPRTDRLRTEVTYVYKLTSAFLKESDVLNDDWVLNNLIVYSKDLRIFLSDADVQNDWKFNRLRLHYCGLMEELFEGINRSRNPSRWLPFESRKSAFTLMENWCGYSAHSVPTSQKDDAMRHFAAEQNHEGGERINVSVAVEKEKSSLRVAALSAMAALCAGPISIKTESKAILRFNLPRMLSWIDSIFAAPPSDRFHVIGRRALKELIVHNKEHPYIMEHAIERCYGSEKLKALESYFAVVAEVLIDIQDYPLPFWRVLGAVLFTLGSESREIRMKSARLLRTLEERQQKSSKLQDFDIGIADKTTAVYKLAQFEYSRRLSKAHGDLAFIIFSEFCLHFKSASSDHQRNMVAAILPWIQTMELQLDPNGGPTAVSYMLLSNLFEITVESSSVLHNEVQALWQALATGPHGGNVQLILDFIIQLSLERKEQNFVNFAKQIVVFLSGTPAGSKVVDFFLLQLIPKNMVNEKRNIDPSPPETGNLPYVADLSAMLPTGNKQAGLSLGQIALIFLVDLMVAPVTLAPDRAAQLIHSVLILWDHYTPSVQEHAREMLVHLIHELVTSKIDDGALSAHREKIETLVEAVRRHESSVVWSYEENNGKEDDGGGSRVPTSMSGLSGKVVDIFSMAYKNFDDLWAKEALHWASTCPVRHLACRSFQMFRCISVTVDLRMLADMLARLSNTISDEQTDYQTFSMEILTTLKVIIHDLRSQDVLRYTQLFWTTCACLNTIHESEFSESLGMLEKLLERLDLSDPRVVRTLLEAKPSRWEGGFEGLQPLVYKGLKSMDSLDRTLSVLDRLAGLPNNEVIGDSSRLLHSILANLPRFLHQFEIQRVDQATLQSAYRLAEVADRHGSSSTAVCLTQFADGKYRSGADFLHSAIAAVRSSFFPEHDGKSLVFLIGFLTNRTPWFKLKTMEILCALIPEVNMRQPDIARHGPDLISPLLRLLQTDLCPQALEVMDHIMEVSGNPMEGDHIRMSLASGSARAIRKEYERTQSLYGIPLSSGWSIPMPAVYSILTRNNVHAVFYTCGDADAMQKNATPTPEVEFRADEGYAEPFFVTKRTNTMKSVDTVPDANMNDLLHKLDSLNDFFDEPQLAAEPIHHHAYGSPDLADTGTSTYDQQTAPILKKSLARTASTSSFHNGLAESRPSTSHQNSVMTPTAFNTTPLSSSVDYTTLPLPAIPTANVPVRPGLHGRSITSPSHDLGPSQPTSAPAIPNFSNGGGGSFLSEEDESCDDTALSDSESSPFPQLTTHISAGLSLPDTSHSTGAGSGSVTPKSVAPLSAGEANGSFSFEGMRRGMRRLTTARVDREREKDRIRDLARMRAMSGGASSANEGPHSSPKVPRVPVEYLSHKLIGAVGSRATSPGS